MNANSKPYIFISYAHVNSDAVLPAIRQMQEQGVSIWYDSGIEAGSEWPEFVAEKVMNCSKFVLFISNAYLQSQNCKRELNFAISRKKDILSVFLEDVQLSPGMEMQLGTYQAIFRKRFANDRQFVQSLAREPFFNSCRQIAQPQPRPQPQPAQPVQPQQAPQFWQNVQNVRGAQPQQRSAPYQPQQQSAPYQPQQLPLKNKWVAILLAFFLGGFGIHKFYLGKPVWGVVYLLLCWTYIPSIIALVEAIIMLAQSDEKFAQKHKCRLQ